MLIRNIAIAACCLGISGAAFGATLSAADKAFLTTAAKANMTEAHEGQMAAEQASRTDVKNFGVTLVQDHTQAYKDLQQVATTVGFDIPNGINTAKDAQIVQLVRLKGEQFDKRFCADQLAGHRSAIALFKREAAHGENADVKAYAARTVPVLEKHLQMAEACAKPTKKS
jgi:putative membrane protein